MNLRAGSALYIALLAAPFAGCGGSSPVGSSPPPPSLATPTVTVTPGASSVTTAQALSVAVAVSGNGATPSGTVALSSGSYASFAASLSSGSAQVTVPAGLLAAGSDTLTASYTPDGASSGTYKSASGAASVAVTALTATPTVTTSSITYPTVSAPFQAVVTGAGTVFVSVSGAGIQVFSPGAGGLTSTCVNPLPSALLGEGAAVANLSLLPNGTDLAAGIGSAGAIFFNLAALDTCTAAGYVVSQGSVASDQGTLEVAVTPDGKYAFVSNEYGVAAGAATEGTSAWSRWPTTPAAT